MPMRPCRVICLVSLLTVSFIACSPWSDDYSGGGQQPGTEAKDSGVSAVGDAGPLDASVTYAVDGGWDPSDAGLVARSDGARLIAHYTASTFLRNFDPSIAQQADNIGGAAAPAGWAPNLDSRVGHVPLTRLTGVTIQQVIVECGVSRTSFSSHAVGASFLTLWSGTKGLYGASSPPGWAVIAKVGDGFGRSNHNLCGAAPNSAVGGLALCDGPGQASSHANHIASYTSDTNVHSAIACDGRGCDCAASQNCTAIAQTSGPASAGYTCPLNVWVWIR